MDPTFSSFDRRQLCSESDSNHQHSTSRGPDVDLPNSPGLISEVDLSRFYPFIYNRDIINYTNTEDGYMESPLEQGTGTRLSVGLTDRDKQGRTMKRVTVLLRDLDAWVDENKEYKG